MNPIKLPATVSFTAYPIETAPKDREVSGTEDFRVWRPIAWNGYLFASTEDTGPDGEFVAWAELAEMLPDANQ